MALCPYDASALTALPYERKGPPLPLRLMARPLRRDRSRGVLETGGERGRQGREGEREGEGERGEPAAYDETGREGEGESTRRSGVRKQICAAPPIGARAEAAAPSHTKKTAGVRLNNNNNNNMII